MRASREMHPIRFRRGHCLLLIGIGITLVTGAWARKADDPPSTPEAQLPPGIKADFVQMVQTSEDEVVLYGPVTIVSEEARLQADRMTFKQQRFVEAEGNVLIVWGPNRVFGSRMTYDLDTRRGRIEDAIGQTQQDFIFWAKSVEKIGEDRIHIKSGTVTTCTQPTPYWSFKVTSATIRVNSYARMWNVRLKIGRMPVFYLPYLVWPVKPDRAAGLLIPTFGNTSTRGSFISQEVFFPLGDSADLTLFARHYTEAGLAGGGELRFLPNQEGAAVVEGFFINDQITQSSRYAGAYRQTQNFTNGYRMVADVNVLSDPNFYTDYARDLELVSTPTIQARLEFSRNGPWTSMNVREFRQEQLLANDESLVQQTFPEVEWRGRSRQLGKTPLYMNYEASVASIQQRGLQSGRTIDADYYRGDVFPTFTLPWSPVSWLDVNPQVSYRYTYYTQRRETTQLSNGTTNIAEIDESIDRGVWRGGIDIIGPKFYRVFKGRKGRTSFKHTVEPRIGYFAGGEFEDQDEIILYDEIDRYSAAAKVVNYRITSRLFAKRPRSRAAPPRIEETILLPEGEVRSNGLEVDSLDELLPPSEEEYDEDAPQESVEVASLEIAQTRSFDTDLSVADLDLDGDRTDTSPYSGIIVTGRFNPSRVTSLDLRGNYDILWDEFSNVTLSGSLRRKLAQFRFSLVHRNGLGVSSKLVGNQVQLVPVENDTQVRLTTNFSLFRRKLQLSVDGTYDSNPSPGQPNFPDKRWRIQYRTQCCTFLVERLSRNYISAADRQDFYFRVDLKGVGKLLDFRY